MGVTSDSDCAPCVEPKLSSTKVRQTFSNLTLLSHQTKTAVPNWLRCRAFAALSSSVRFGMWVERRLNRALFLYLHCPFSHQDWVQNRILLWDYQHKIDITRKSTPRITKSSICCMPNIEEKTSTRKPQNLQWITGKVLWTSIFFSVNFGHFQWGYFVHYTLFFYKNIVFLG